MFPSKGTGIAIITPFKADGSIDFAALEKLVEHWINGKAEYLVVLGTTGESVTLDKREKTEIFDFVTARVDGRVPVVLGVGGNNTAEVTRSLGDFDLRKASAILSVSPYYNKPTQEGIYQHFKYFAQNCPLPVILYNVPGRTSSNMLPETTLRLASDVENIVAVKEASGNLEQIMYLVQHKPKDFLVISGDDSITLPLVAAGVDGVISVVANAYPNEFSEMVRLTAASKLSEARELHYKLMNVIQYLFLEGNPAGIKAVMKHLGLCEDHVRLPLVAVSPGLDEKIRNAAKL